ncbi:mechanosensitive ion channel protein [Corticibacter populi]|uniref:Mechanosensitive ion channel protein n=2 Tax=Corticibacter populi TaxID=1550736 RepID=A0A3M6QMN2_9BURK|nr:mechanosensitive ion channel protein [Corticibacter populi]RZS33137.1 mechanosensitive ion channel-like protein [Corticibacter populi]
MGTALAGSTLGDWLRQFDGPRALLELAVIAAVLLLIWLLLRGLRAALNYQNADSVLFGANGADGVLLPLLGLAGLRLVQPLLAPLQPLHLWPLAMPILVSLLAIRLSIKVLRLAYPGRAWLEPIARSFSWFMWFCVVAWITGLGPTLMHELDQVHWTIGARTISLRRLLEALVTAVASLLISLWVSSAIESRMMHSVIGARLPVHKVITTMVRAVLLLIGMLVALNMAGIDLTALSVFGGALGVGIGLGLQRLAANYVSGFVLMVERSVRVGDVVRVNGFQGTIVDMSGRYTSIVSTSGRQAIVPHELMTNSMVENLSSEHRASEQSTTVSVAHDCDVDQVRALLAQAVASVPEVLAAPAPEALLLEFGADGLRFKIEFEIADPHNGDNEDLLSKVNLAILKALRAHGVAIPYPQRTLHWAGNADAPLTLVEPQREQPAPVKGVAKGT